MVEAGEVVAEVRVEHPVHLLAHDPGSERIQRVMRAATRPEPVGEAQEVRLIDGVQHLDQRPLKDLVLQRGDTERPQPPIGLWYVHPPRRPRPVCAPVNPSVQVPKILLEIHTVVRPRDPVHPGRGLRPKREVRRSQAVDVNMVQERGEPRFLVRCCHAAYATKLTERALPGTESGARFASRVSLGWSPSLHHLRRPALGIVRAASQVVRDHPTSHDRPSRDYGLGLPRTTRPSITTGG